MPHQMPITIPFVVDLAIAVQRFNVMAGIPQRIIKEPSRVEIALTREGVDVTYEVTIGSTIAIPAGSPCNVVAALGSNPRFDQDGLGFFGGDENDEIAIFGTNVNAAAQEFRGQIRIVALSDLELALGTGG